MPSKDHHLIKSDPKLYYSRYYKIEPNTGCWLWTGAVTGKGYGCVDSIYSKIAHKLMYILYKGSIPEGLVLDHLCRVKICVNPDHLEPVSNKENILRGNTPKFTKEERKKIWELHCDGMPTYLIVKKFNSVWSTIDGVIRTFKKESILC